MSSPTAKLLAEVTIIETCIILVVTGVLSALIVATIDAFAYGDDHRRRSRTRTLAILAVALGCAVGIFYVLRSYAVVTDPGDPA